jgi:hypothetical protein
VLAVSVQAGPVVASGDAQRASAPPSIACGKLNPRLNLYVSQNGSENQFRLDREVALGPETTSDAVESAPNPWRGRAEFAASCAQGPGAMVAVQLDFDVVRRGGCTGPSGSCARASPRWRTVAVLPEPGVISVELVRQGADLPLTCSIQVGPTSEQSVLAPLRDYVFQPIPVPAGKYDVVVDCPRVVKACRLFGDGPRCNGDLVVREDASLAIIVRVELDSDAAVSSAE